MSAPSSGLMVVQALEIVHAVTGESLQPLQANVVPPAWSGWRVLIRGHVIALAADAADIAAMPQQTTLQIQVTRSAVAGVLADSGSATVTLERPLTLAGPPSLRTRRLGLAPAAGQLELHLCDEHGEPLAKHRVAVVPIAKHPAKPSSKGKVALSETKPGVYRSAVRPWTSDLHPFSILIDGVAVATRVFDHQCLLTRLRLVVPLHLLNP